MIFQYSFSSFKLVILFCFICAHLWFNVASYFSLKLLFWNKFFLNDLKKNWKNVTLFLPKINSEPSFKLVPVTNLCIDRFVSIINLNRINLTSEYLFRFQGRVSPVHRLYRKSRNVFVPCCIGFLQLSFPLKLPWLHTCTRLLTYFQ